MASRLLTDDEIRWWQRSVELYQSVDKMSRPEARVLAFLVLQDEPITLDELAAGTGMSKTAASSAASSWVHVGTLRRDTVPGSNRRLYYIDPTITEQRFIKDMTAYADRLKQSIDNNLAGAAVARSETVRRQFEEFAELCQVLIEMVTEVVQRVRQRIISGVETG